MSVEAKAKYHGKVLQVAVPSPLRRVFDYLPLPQQQASPEPQAGIRVKVSFGRQQLIGIVVAVANSSILEKKKLKPILASLDTEPLLNAAVFKLLLWAANYYQHPLGEVFAAALPAKLRNGNPLRESSKVWTASEPSTSQTSLLGRAVKQKALLSFIRSAGEVTESKLRQAGFSKMLLVQLLQKNLIEEHSRTEVAASFEALEPESSFDLELNEEQLVAVTTISKALQGYKCFLLNGITGSGKTEVYMRIMQEQLSKGLQCLVLVPEIGLTPQTIARFKQRFSCLVVSLHSGLNETERMTAWLQARDGSAGIVIGTRSAIFTPLANPGLIVIDEEHDASFKQQDGFRYSARDLAVSRAQQESISIVLGSATPSLESLHNAQSNKFVHLHLSQRTGIDQPSAMEVIDVSN